VENKQVVQEFRRAADAFEFAAAGDMLSDSVRWWVPRSAAQLGFERPVQGREEVVGLMSRATGRFYKPGTLKREYHRYVAEGDFVAVWFTMTAKTTDGGDYANDYHLLYRCEDGRIAEVWEHLDTAYALSRFKA